LEKRENKCEALPPLVVPLSCLSITTSIRCSFFGTEEHDFICAMYGEMTVALGTEESLIPLMDATRSFASRTTAPLAQLATCIAHAAVLPFRLYENIFS
jgi:hypothetical protein